jgi:hypothetical protein
MNIGSKLWAAKSILSGVEIEFEKGQRVVETSHDRIDMSRSGSLA